MGHVPARSLALARILSRTRRRTADAREAVSARSALGTVCGVPVPHNGINNRANGWCLVV